MNLAPYINFNGNCKQAVEFYAQAFGVEANIMTYGQMPPDTQMPLPDEMKNHVMHASFSYGEGILMFSDAMPGMPVIEGNNVNVMLALEDGEELNRIYKALSEGGVEIMPLGPTFWSKMYGQFKDKFGIIWQMNLNE